MINKKSFVLLLFALLLLGCKTSDSEKKKLINVQEYILPIEENAEVTSFYYKDGEIYYNVSHLSYYEMMITETSGGYRYTDDLSTEIHVYDVECDTDELVYRFDDTRPTEITNILATTDTIYWEEYSDTGFSICSITKNVDGVYLPPERLFTSADIESTMYSISPCIYNDILYWYEPNDIYFRLVGYENGHIYKHQNDIFLSSPYETPLMANGLFSYAKKEDTIKVFSTKALKETEVIDCSFSDIGTVFSGKHFITWTDGYYHNYDIEVYNIREKSAKKLDLDYFFSIGLIDDFLFVDTDKELLMYQCDSLEKIKSWPGRYLFILQNDEGDLFCQNLDTGGILIITK